MKILKMVPVLVGLLVVTGCGDSRKSSNKDNNAVEVQTQTEEQPSLIENDGLVDFNRSEEGQNNAGQSKDPGQADPCQSKCGGGKDLPGQNDPCQSKCDGGKDLPGQNDPCQSKCDGGKDNPSQNVSAAVVRCEAEVLFRSGSQMVTGNRVVVNNVSELAGVVIALGSKCDSQLAGDARCDNIDMPRLGASSLATYLSALSKKNMIDRFGSSFSCAYRAI